MSNWPEADRERARQRGSEEGEGPEVDSPLDYLLAVVRDRGETPARRMSAAEKAAPYCHPKLSHTVVEDRSAVDMKALLDDIRAERARLGRPAIDLEPLAVVPDTGED